MTVSRCGHFANSYRYGSICTIPSRSIESLSRTARRRPQSLRLTKIKRNVNTNKTRERIKPLRARHRWTGGARTFSFQRHPHRRTATNSIVIRFIFADFPTVLIKILRTVCLTCATRSNSRTWRVQQSVCAAIRLNASGVLYAFGCKVAKTPCHRLRYDATKSRRQPNSRKSHERTRARVNYPVTTPSVRKRDLRARQVQIR